ncbi:glycosyltransferase family 2 protein [Methylocella sp. CPCC 101449]|uniref:glycosyltransferase family 2 protein n=1 Tax=Methylocella sp. CPCC 101449 TaxID=2987531 RepID=UPI00288F970A|nr:glycosyltransferase family 2 protein [Methylocella sp. CPCC 101449]MDT2024441.1 glycosyltransferase [Methylocella sp. CPCC 101449]
MAAITIGVPVYNEEVLLERALEALRTQPFTDIEVLIYDNASTDATPEIAQRFVISDSRFRYFRQAENRGALLNFNDVLNAATSPYFLWRACDDQVEPDFVGKLHAALEANPDKLMAGARVVSCDLDGAHPRTFPVPQVGQGTGPLTRWKLLFHSHPSWIYCLFRREPLVERMRTVVTRYRHQWAADHLTLFPYLFDNTALGVDTVTFNQVLRRVRPGGAKRRPRVEAELALMEDLRGRFLAVLRDDLAERKIGGVSGLFYRWMLWVYTGKRVYKFRKVIRRRFKRDVLGIAEKGGLVSQ